MRGNKRKFRWHIITIGLLFNTFQIAYASNSESVSSSKQLSYSQFNIFLLLMVIVLILFSMVIRIITNKELSNREIVRRERQKEEELTESRILDEIRKRQKEDIGGTDDSDKGQTDLVQKQKSVQSSAVSTEPKQVVKQQEPRQPVDLTRHRQPSRPVHKLNTTGEVKVTPDDVIRQAQQIKVPIKQAEDDDIVPMSVTEAQLKNVIKPESTTKQNNTENISQEQKKAEEKKATKPSLIDSVIDRYEQEATQEDSIDEDVVPGSISSTSGIIQTPDTLNNKNDNSIVETSQEYNEDDPFIDLEPDDCESFFGVDFTLKVDWNTDIVEDSGEVQGEQTQPSCEEQQIEPLEIRENTDVVQDTQAEQTEQNQVIQSSLGETQTEINEVDSESDSPDSRQILKGAKTAQDIANAFQPRKRKKKRK